MAQQGSALKTFVDMPVVQTHLRGASKMVGERLAVHFLESMDGCMRHLHTPLFDSPLEVLFWLWWSACERANWDHFYDAIHLDPQVELEVQGERFRLDFAVTISDAQIQRAIDANLLTWPLIGVEVDGHEFHERTREQVALRDRRDRLLQQAGWQIFHYSWAEFTKEPERCVSEVYDIATSAYVELYRQYHQDIPVSFRTGA